MNTIRPVTDRQENCSLVFLVYKELHMMDQRSYSIKETAGDARHIRSQSRYAAARQADAWS